MVAWLSNQVYVHGINYVKASDLTYLHSWGEPVHVKVKFITSQYKQLKEYKCLFQAGSPCNKSQIHRIS